MLKYNYYLLFLSSCRNHWFCVCLCIPIYFYNYMCNSKLLRSPGVDHGKTAVSMATVRPIVSCGVTEWWAVRVPGLGAAATLKVSPAVKTHNGNQSSPLQTAFDAEIVWHLQTDHKYVFYTRLRHVVLESVIDFVMSLFVAEWYTLCLGHLTKRHWFPSSLL